MKAYIVENVTSLFEKIKAWYSRYKIVEYCDLYFMKQRLWYFPIWFYVFRTDGEMNAHTSIYSPYDFKGIYSFCTKGEWLELIERIEKKRVENKNPKSIYPVKVENNV